jgi:hypothetical protein
MRRRELLLAGVALAVARPATARGQDRDGDIVKGLIAREEGAAYAYRGLRLPGVADVSAQDDDHAEALRTELQALGRGTSPISAADLDAPTRRLAEASRDEDRLDAAIALEAHLVSSYSAAVVALSEPGILQTAATILACHAQRRARLLRGDGRDPFG